MRSLINLFLVALVVLATSQSAFAQRPFGNIDPNEEETEGQEGAFNEDEPVRPIERRPAANPLLDRPQDDELGFDRVKQTAAVNERYAGWREAAGFNTDERVGDTLRANWVMVDRNGEFEGTVRGVDGAEVAGMTIYLMNKGRLVKSTAVQSNGSFAFNNVQRGAYSMIGWGDRAFFTFGLNILSFNPKADDSTPTTMAINAFQNATTINTDWLRYYAPNISYRVYGKYTTEEGEDDPSRHYGYEGLTRYQPSAAPATSVGGVPVSLSGDGSLVGRVHQMNSLNGRPVEVRSTKVMLLKGDNVVASATTDNFGVFGIAGVQPGSYGLVAVGVDGVGSVGINVAGSGSVMMDANGEFAAQQGGGRPFDFCLVSSETVGWLNHYAREVAYNRAILAPRRPDTKREWGTGPVGGAGTGQCNTCGGACNNGGTCCNDCKRQQCSSPYLTFAQWQQMGCANCGKENKDPLIQRVGEKLRDGIQKLDTRFEDAFYKNEGNGISGGIPGYDYSRGYQPQQQLQGYPAQGGYPYQGAYPQQNYPAQGAMPMQQMQNGMQQMQSMPMQGATPIQAIQSGVQMQGALPTPTVPYQGAAIYPRYSVQPQVQSQAYVPKAPYRSQR